MWQHERTVNGTGLALPMAYNKTWLNVALTLGPICYVLLAYTRLFTNWVACFWCLIHCINVLDNDKMEYNLVVIVVIEYSIYQLTDEANHLASV